MTARRRECTGSWFPECDKDSGGHRHLLEARKAASTRHISARGMTPLTRLATLAERCAPGNEAVVNLPDIDEGDVKHENSGDKAARNYKHYK